TDKDFVGANPTLYPFLTTSTQASILGGAAANPISGATFDTGVSSLEPSQVVLGQIVPFEFLATANGSFVFDFDTHTTSNDAFGYDPTVGNNGLYGAFVDTADAQTTGSGATVSGISVVLNGTNIEPTLTVSGLAAGQQAVVEIWVVLDSTIPAGVG